MKKNSTIPPFSYDFQRGDDLFRKLTSIRSPKDAVINTPEFKKLISENLHNQKRKNEPLAVIHALNAALKITSGKHALEMLTTSERIYTDLFRSLLFLDEKLKKQKNAEMPRQQIIVRKYYETKPEFEFRAFVVNGKMTALTQYFSSVYVEEVKIQKSQIEKQIRTCFEQVQKTLNTSENYSIDFTFGRDEKVYIIELNPFSEQTAPGLFNWRQDECILKGVGGSFEFRIVEKEFSKEEGRKKMNQEIQKILEEIDKSTTYKSCTMM